MLHKKHFLTFLMFVFCMCNHSLKAQEIIEFQSRIPIKSIKEAPIKLIPYPKKVTWISNKIQLTNIQIKEENQLHTSIKKELTALFLELNIVIDSKALFYIEFEENKSLSNEAYKLNVFKNRIRVQSKNEAGQFYALQTLRQLISLNESKTLLQQCVISDEPMHSFRGYMLDVGRNFMSLELLKEQLDIMAKYKLNVFQWHLTDRPAWRIESKKYPELVEAKNHRQTRNPGMYYTYDEIRELINYAKEKQILVIPEIDMPGHSDSFVTAMGCKMESEKGMLILENVLEEFFNEIPKDMCPIVHLGSDEVQIPNPEAFMKKMISVCTKNEREVVVWNPGIKVKDDAIRQTWQGKHQENGDYREIDSWNSYINNSEPMTAIPKLLFKPVGYKSKNKIIGGIICMWPDVKLQNEYDFINQNPVYPSMLTYAWSTWTADVKNAPQNYLTKIPPKGTKEFDYFNAFEDYLLNHKKRYFKNKPFQYFKQSNKEWLISEPILEEDVAKVEESLIQNRFSSVNFKKAYGNTIIIKDRFKQGGYFPTAKTNQTVYAKTHIYSDEDRKVKTWLGFETPLRANRAYTGIPESGSWDACGGNIWVNGENLKSPKWRNAGWKPSKQEGWGAKEDQEIPWRKEELYWTREPTVINLKKGKNTIMFKVPSCSNYQNWMFTFIPLNMEGLHFSIN